MYPVLFNIGETFVYALGVCYVLGFIVFNMLVFQFSGFKKLNIKFWSNHIISLVVVTVIGARIGYVLLHSERFLETPSEILLPDGFSFYGGICFFLVLLYIHTKRDRENLLAWTDVFSISFFGWLIFASLGHFLDGTNFGIPTDLPWGVTFDNILSPVPYSVPIHPTQLYQSLFALLCLVGLFLAYWKIKTPGLITFLSGFLLGIFDYFLAYLLGEPTIMLGSMRIEQMFSLLIVAVTSALLFSFVIKKNDTRLARSHAEKQTHPS